MADFDNPTSPPPLSSSSSPPPLPAAGNPPTDATTAASSPPPPSSSSSPPPPPPQPPVPIPPPPPPATGKRKDPPAAATSSTGPSPSKRPNIPRPPRPPLPSLPAGAASSGDVQDTATSEPLDVELDDLEILERIMEHREEKGYFPFETPDAMNAFIVTWSTVSGGTEDGWKKRIEKLEKKFNSGSQPVEEEDKKLFDLWMKIWGKEGGDDHDPSGGAVGV